MKKIKVTNLLSSLWVMFLFLLCSFPFLIGETCNSFFPDCKWYPLHIVGGSIFLFENIIVACLFIIALIFRIGRWVLIFLSAFVSLHWTGLLIISTTDLFEINRILQISSIVFLMFLFANIFILSRKNTKLIFNMKK